MTEMFGEAWSPMSVPDLAPDDDDDHVGLNNIDWFVSINMTDLHEMRFLCFQQFSSYHSYSQSKSRPMQKEVF